MLRFFVAPLAICLAITDLGFAQESPAFQNPRNAQPRRAQTPGAETPRAESPRADAVPTANRSELSPRTGRMVTVEVLLVDGPSDVVRGIESADEPLKQLQRLEEEEALSGVTRIRVTTLEQQPASVQFGQRINLRSAAGPGGGFPGGGRGASMVRGENTGTLLSATARVESDESIVLNLQFEQSRLASPRERDPSAGEDPSAPPDVGTITAQTTLRVVSGGVEVLGGGRTSTGKTSEQSLILVTAKAGPAIAATALRADTERGEFKIFHLAHASADGIAQLLTQVFLGRPVRAVADTRTNSVLVRGDTQELEVVEALLARLDVEKNE